MDTLSPQFRPISSADFSQYAKNLAWLIEEPLQKSQEILARAYGYSSLHELQQALNSPAPPSLLDAHQTLPASERSQIAAFGSRLLALIGTAKNCTPELLKPRYREVKWLALQSGPGAHRKARNWLRRRFAALSALADLPTNAALTDYISSFIDTDGERKAAFTKLGYAVYEAAASLIPPSPATLDEICEVDGELLGLIEAHVNHPWPAALHIGLFSPIYEQGPWTPTHPCRPWDARDSDLDANEQFVRYAGSTAEGHLPGVQETIELMDRVFHHPTTLPEANDLVEKALDPADFYDLLYWGGRIAANAGELELAHKWLERHWTESPNRSDTRYILSTLRLMLGKGEIADLFTLKGEPVEASAWAQLALAAEAFVRNQRAQAAGHYAAALIDTWASAEPFRGNLTERATLATGSNQKKPANIQEFMARTARFWAVHPEAKEFFRGITNVRTVHAALLEYHRFRTSSIQGDAAHSKPVEEIHEEQHTLESLERKLETTVMEVAKAPWF